MKKANNYIIMFLILAAVFSGLAACEGGYIDANVGDSRNGGFDNGKYPSPPDPPKPVVPVPDGAKEYTVNIVMEDNESGDAVTASPDNGNEGDTVTLNYTVANKTHYNLLDFSGVTAGIATVNSAGSGTRTYIINPADSSNGVITITAIFTHTDLEPDPIAFTDTAGHITKTYGDAPFTNAVTNAHHGTGAINYHSNDETVATVDSSGQVTILKAGSVIITAEKAADGRYAHARKDYTLNIIKAADATVTTPTVSGTPTAASIAVNAASLNTSTGQDIEYAISMMNDGTGLSAWQSGTTFSGLTASATYYVYARSAENENYNAGTASGASAGITTPPPPDTKPPALSNGSVIRLTNTQAQISFTTDEAGTAYYLVRDAGAAEPVSAQVKDDGKLLGLGGVTSGANTGKPVDITTSEARDIYVVVEDAAGNISAPLKIQAEAHAIILRQDGTPIVDKLIIIQPGTIYLTTNDTYTTYIWTINGASPQMTQQLTFNTLGKETYKNHIISLTVMKNGVVYSDQIRIRIEP